MIRQLTVLTLAVAPMLVAGCKREPNVTRPDAAYMALNEDLKKQGMKRLDFQEASVDKVVAWLESELGYKVQREKAAEVFIQQTDPRVTARTGEVPASLAYEVLRSMLEAKGLTLEPLDNLFGKPKLLLDRSVLRDGTVPTAAR